MIKILGGTMAETITIGQYLIDQLYDHGLEHIFGIPGDYVLGFYKQLSQSKIKVINTSDEQGAGFAADAYARVRGLGAVCVTYCVGGLKVANTTAEAYSEKSPVLIISGAPGTKERQKHALLHHKVRDFDTQKKVFDQLTVASTVLDDPQTAQAEIDRVLHTVLRYKRPGYIEIPRDIVALPGVEHYTHPQVTETSDPDILAEALNEALVMINAAQKPVILAGAELHRFGLQNHLIILAEKTGIPVASTILGKSVIAENLPFYLGVYEGATGRDDVREYVESSDCLVMLGVFMTDVNLGIFTAKIEPAHTISVTSEKLSIRYHNYENVYLHDFVHGLITADIRERTLEHVPHPPQPKPFCLIDPNAKITIQRLSERLNAFLKDNTIVIADVGDSLFTSGDFFIHRKTQFLSPAYYTSMGFAVPAAIGAQFADPTARPIVLVGDGAFQMTGMELSTIAHYHLNPIVIVLNNGGYLTERGILDGPFNDLHPWQFSKIPDVLGSGKGFIVETEGQFEAALTEAEKNTDSFSILDVRLDPTDGSPALKRLSEKLSKRV
jgi:TPP-dependent 2-oxoacid decarboxylase